MKSKDLIKQLEKHPDWNVSVSVDISTNDEDADHRVFGDNIIEIIRENNRNQFTICLEGYDNYNLYEKYQNTLSALLSIYDSLKLHDNGLLQNDETLSETMFRKMKVNNVDLNKELGFTHLKPITQKDEK
jgi:hypothetical protein